MTPKPEMPKPDKYDEAARAIFEAIILWQSDIADTRPAWDIIAIQLRSAFPSAPSVAESAEDAQACAEFILSEVEEGTPHNRHYRTRTIDEAAAELEAFARSRVKPWRDGVRAALEYSGNRWSEWGERAEHVGEILDALLSADDAKEAAK